MSGCHFAAADGTQIEFSAARIRQEMLASGVYGLADTVLRELSTARPAAEAPAVLDLPAWDPSHREIL